MQAADQLWAMQVQIGPGPADVDGADPASDDSSGSVDIDGIGSVDMDGAGSTEVDGADSADIDGTGPTGVKTSQHRATNFTNSVPPVRCLNFSSVLHSFWTWYLYDEGSSGTTSFNAVSICEITRSCSVYRNHT